MQQMKYRIRFLTPAFLGNAEQSGQWRTPPFKALLRQWWRVIYAGNKEFVVDLEEMRRTEGLLFGNAWLNHTEDGRMVADHCKSRIRMRLDRWSVGGLRNWDGLEQGAVHHPELQRTGFKVGPHAYLGYGSLDGRGGTKFGKPNAAIQSGERACLSLAFPEGYAQDVRMALALMSAYGTVGGRSRNGWGSFVLEPLDGSPNLDAGADAPRQRFLRSWGDALALDWDWPHAIGRDGTGPLVWQTAESHTDWKALMRDLAILKIGLRTMFVFPDARPPHPRPLDRHWLSYPITKHLTKQWDRNARLPNSLPFKVRPDPAGPIRMRGVIFHVPCLPPAGFGPDEHAIRNVWRTVHRLLDELTLPSGQRDYAMIDDDKRRERLKQSLDSLTLERSPE